jgi:PAS domain S-box-containing protein
MVIDENGKMVSYNQRFLDMWGISEESTGAINCDFYLQTVLEKLPEPEQFTERIKYLYDHQDEKSREEIILKDGRVFDRYSSPMSGPDGQYLGRVWYFRDISAQKQAEKEKTIMEDKLRQTQKMEAIGTLAGGIAHDFNNILSASIGYLELVKMELPSASPVHNDLEEVFKASLRAKDLVRQIMTFSRKTKADKKDCQLNLLVKETIKLLRASIPATIEIRQNIPVQCPNIVADPTQIHQIVMNLGTNAYHAMRKSGGVLSVSLQELTIGPDDKLMGGSLKPGPYLQLEIIDTGKGIPPEILTNIFEPYFTTKEVNEGIGLGLSVVHGIVKSHHGHITVDSEVGKGTSFKVYLPAEVRDAESKSPETGKEILGGSERIIFVDDEKPLVRLNKKLLSNLGYEVAAFSNSREALKSFSEAPNKYDLIITDMSMPKMTGAEMAREIKKIRSDIPIILCTGFTENLDEKWATETGFCAYLAKPVLMKDLTDTIRKSLELGC